MGGCTGFPAALLLMYTHPGVLPAHPSHLSSPPSSPLPVHCPPDKECRKDRRLLCLCRVMRALWASRRSNQSVLKEINPEYSLEGPMMMLKLLYFGHLMRRADS